MTLIRPNPNLQKSLNINGPLAYESLEILQELRAQYVQEMQALVAQLRAGNKIDIGGYGRDLMRLFLNVEKELELRKLNLGPVAE